MKKKIGFKSIRSRLFFWFLMIALSTLIVFSIITYIMRVNDIREVVFTTLKTIRDLKVEQLYAWFHDRMSDVQSITWDYELRNLEQVLAKKNYELSDIKKLELAQDLLDSYMDFHGGWLEISVINTINGEIILSTNKDMIKNIKTGEEYFNIPIQNGDFYLSDIYFSQLYQKPTITLSFPVFCMESDPGAHIFAVVVTHIDLDQSLYALLLNREGMGDTGELMIVNKNFTVLNDLRWYIDAPLQLKVETEDIKQALSGETGIIETADYRQQRIISAFKYIPEFKWAFISKQDQTEVYRPVLAILFSIFTVFIFFMLVVFIISFLISRQISLPIIEMVSVSRHISNGEYSARNQIQRRDELGQLAEAFNKMADIIIAKNQALQKHNIETEQSLQESENELKMLSAKLLEIQEEERKRVSRELHDSAGQMLTSIKIGIENIIKKVEAKKNHNLLSLLKKLVPRIMDSMEEIRRISVNLRPLMIDELGIIATINWLCRDFQKDHNSISIDKEISVQEFLIPDKMKIVIFRILQEALNNITKHSGANTVKIILKEFNKKLELIIRDNGRGFNINDLYKTLPAQRGLGIASMKERAKLSAGFLQVESTIGKGTSIIAWWKLY